MKSLKNHLSLITALFTILFTYQIFIVVDRISNSYEEQLNSDYSLIIVTKNSAKEKEFLSVDPLISSIIEIEPDEVIKKINSSLDEKSVNELKEALPKFFTIKLKSYPTPYQVETLNNNLLKHSDIEKVEDFSSQHDSTYELLLLFKYLTKVFSIAILVITTLLILKEMRIWQFQHNERMSIMALFGAPMWLRSAVLFRLAIVDAFASTILVLIVFPFIAKAASLHKILEILNIDVVLFNTFNDSIELLVISLTLSIVLALAIVLTHKENV
ncbi:MAG: cell division protein FtsX [Campylobacterota bacterium]|nr:cell division protein FtsX [Campylobacterota bacterium]